MKVQAIIERLSGDEPVTIRVRCQGSLHRIVLTERGRLVLCDHDDVASTLAAEEAAQEVGCTALRCGAILRAWRDVHNRERCETPLTAGSYQPLPRALRTVARRHIDQRDARRKGKKRDRLTLPVRERLMRRTRRAAQRMLAEAAYRKSRSSWAGGDHTMTVEVGSLVDIRGESERVWSIDGKWSGTNSHVVASIRDDWYLRVYRHGLALIEGMFVLDALPTSHGRWRVCVGRQGRGFAIHPAWARWDGIKLRWIK